MARRVAQDAFCEPHGAGYTRPKGHIKKEPRIGGCTLPPVVGPIPETDNWRTICRNLDTIYEAHDDGVHKGLCRRNWGRLDHCLAKIERSAKSARALLRPNPTGQATVHKTEEHT